MKLENRINAWAKVGEQLGTDSPDLEAAIHRACAENPWFTPDHCRSAIHYWAESLNVDALTEFTADHDLKNTSKKVGIVMAGNIPLVGLHDLLCVSLSGHHAVIKTSSEDKALMKFVIGLLKQADEQLGERVVLTEQLPKGIDAVIATGSNNTFRYFEHYFKDIPHILRRNRKSLAVLDGDETSEDLTLLADDIFSYFGLGCRNVSLVFIPEGMDVTRILDHFSPYITLGDHHRFANNYTYHKALFLMNQQEHLDTGFVLVKESRDLHVPLGCLFYSTYNKLEDVDAFIEANAEDIQCIVGKNYKQADVEYGRAQHPELQDYADKVNSLAFLEALGAN